MTRPEHARSARRLLLNRRFQLSIIGYAAALGLAVLAVQFASDWYFFNEFRKAGLLANLKSDHPYFRLIGDQAHYKSIISAVSAALILLASTIWGLVISHRVAGPLTKLRGHLEAVGRGEKAGPLSFRKGDYFQELVEPYNRAVSTDAGESGRKSA